ncbi:PREDICTED: uncharacterized protein LOC108971801 [Bactrocera latifrons]|uniref:uncharacterized protein LOC108971801 n=1 Tax=Bactrocera latifrons TaxID=174628 RepID=UPI0008DC93D0|nr:PREDICTED: uncharacterized protein LOC108971801 [Bactrocera latifrons]
MFRDMISTQQQILRNRRRMSALTTLQQRIAANSARSDRFHNVKKQTQTLREFFEDLQVEENRIKREILKIAQKIKRLEKVTVEDAEDCQSARKGARNS